MLKAFLISTLLFAAVDFVNSAALSTKRREDIFSVTVPVVTETEPTDLQKTTTEEQPQKDEGFFNHEDRIVLMHQNAPNMILPPPPMFDPRIPCLVPYVIGGPPNCQCIEKGRCTIERLKSTKFLLLKTDLVCGGDYEPCCYEDSAYSGKLDGYEIKCVPQEKCSRSYGQGATDVAEFGIFPPCPGYGAVRCLDHLGVAPFIQEPAVFVPPMLLPGAVQAPAIPNVLDDHELKCIPQDGCVRSFGQSPTDVANFGNIPPCPVIGYVRCLDHLGVAPFIPEPYVPRPQYYEIAGPLAPILTSIQSPSLPPMIPAPTLPFIPQEYVPLPPPSQPLVPVPVLPQFHEPDNYMECIPVTMCTRRFYGQSPTDVAEFGPIPPCPEFGFVRCLDHLGVGPFIPIPAPPPAVPLAPLPQAPSIQPVPQVDDYVLQCIPETICTRSYGQSPTDIRDFGVFPPCPQFGFVRCLDHLGVGPFIPEPYVPLPPPSQPSVPVPVLPQFHEPDNYMECIPETMCTRSYGQGVTDIRDFGVFPPCPQFGFVRCLDHLGVGPVPVIQEMAPPPMPVFPSQPIQAPPVFPQPSFPVIELPPQQQLQPQAPIIEQFPQLPIPVPETEITTQELAPPQYPPRVYPYLGFRFPLVSTPYTSYGAPLGGVYGAPIPSRIGQYGFNGLNNFPLAPLFSKRISFGL